jgi:hypothetical protein
VAGQEGFERLVRPCRCTRPVCTPSEMDYLRYRGGSHYDRRQRDLLVVGSRLIRDRRAEAGSTKTRQTWFARVGARTRAGNNVRSEPRNQRYFPDIEAAARQRPSCRSQRCVAPGCRIGRRPQRQERHFQTADICRMRSIAYASIHALDRGHRERVVPCRMMSFQIERVVICLGSGSGRLGLSMKRMRVR